MSLARRQTCAFLVIVFGSDNHKLVSASRDGTAHLWDLSSSTPTEPVKTLPKSSEGVTPVGISPNLRWLVVAGATGSNRTVQLFDLSSETFPAPVKTIPLTDSPTFGIVFSPDSRWFVTLPQGVSDFGLFEFPTARLWELSDVSSLLSHLQFCLVTKELYMLLPLHLIAKN
ncbi:WD40 repeat domain-containing protein [Microseira sp. BLCC-F43]|jgi:WD40 repeat protein|uniref:WD40 repeat domain-containing protein n=1 Tax=Microseira sp. BLCC-F43 TaxID=3153602 RepID=UPI0035BB3309